MGSTRIRRWLACAMLSTAIVATALPSGPADAAVTYNGAGSAPRIGIIGDSALAGIRWTNSYTPLRRYNFLFDAESCRRTTAASCRGREGYAPTNALTALRRQSGQWGSILVMATGYNDPGYGFAGSVDAIMAEAASQGIPKVMWLTMRTADVTYASPTYRSNSSTFRDNNRILLQKAQQYGGRLVVADWATYSSRQSNWFYADGVHYRPAGAWAAAEFIANQAARVLAGENITSSPGSPSAPTWTNVGRGARGATVSRVQQALISRGYSILGGADGAFGLYTEQAVRRFQQANGLPASGVVDANTAIRLGIYDPSGSSTSTGWTDLRQRMGGRAVAEAQQALIDRGVFVRGGATGAFDVYTYYAVQTFQRYNGLSVTGVIDAATARKLGLFAGAWSELRQGMAGSRVTSAQQALMDRGVVVRGGATGRFDVYTYFAVQTFQRWQGLPVTGVIDDETARRLEVHFAPASSDVWTNLSRGLVGSNVERAQQAMMDRGVFVRGGVTGRFDVYTFYAVQTFQRYNGLAVTGVIDVATARKLGLFDRSDPIVAWNGLRVWSNGLNVERAQQALMDRGVFVRGGVTGRFDVYTYYAVQTFQRYNGLAVTGVIDVATARKLGLFDQPDPTVGWTVLRVSSAGPNVSRAQRALIDRGVFVRGGVTGRFDVYTFYAVQTFQRYNGLAVTGVINVATARKLGLFGDDATMATATAASPAVLSATAAPAPEPTTTTSTTTTTTSTIVSAAAASVDETASTVDDEATVESTEESTTEPGVGVGTVGDLIWLDSNLDGRQDDDERGVFGVVVRLFAGDREVAATTSDADGMYEFTDVAAGTYEVEIELPSDLTITANDQGFDDDLDSEAVEVDEVDENDRTARTRPFAVDGTTPVDSIDIGLVPRAPAESVPSTDPTPSALPDPSTTVVPTSEPPETTEPVPPTEPPATSPPETTVSPTTAAQPPPTSPPTTVPVATDPPASEPTVAATTG